MFLNVVQMVAVKGIMLKILLALIDFCGKPFSNTNIFFIPKTCFHYKCEMEHSSLV